MDGTGGLLVIAIATIAALGLQVLRLQMPSSGMTSAGMEAPTRHPEMRLVMDFSYVLGMDGMGAIS